RTELLGVLECGGWTPLWMLWICGREPPPRHPHIHTPKAASCRRTPKLGKEQGTTQETIDMAKYVYFFGSGKAEGRADMKNLLGGKGANLAEMTNIGLPVPAGFTITTEVCTYYYDHNKTYPPELKAEVQE